MPNLKLAVRTLVRTPFVTAVAILSLALGIGANTAIFSLIQRVLLNPLPVPEPDRLVNVVASGPNPGSQSCNMAGNCDIILTYPMYRDLERAETGLSLAGHRWVPADLAFRGRTSSGGGEVVSGSYFTTLGLTPALGRLFNPDDDRVIGGNPLVVLSYRYWANELGADPSVLNQPILVNGHSMTIIGVAPKGFDGNTLGSRARVYVPLTMRTELEPWYREFTDRRSYWVYAFGRLKPGVSRADGESRINGVYHPIIVDVELPLQQGVPDQALAEFKAKKLRLEPGRRGQSTLHAQTFTPLALLFSVTGIVLLVACTNVASLLLAKAAARSSEMAVRSSLGAGRGQLMAQLLTESGLLAVAAGIASLVVARGTLTVIVSFLPSDLSQTVDFGLDAPVLLFAMAVSLGTSFLFGLLPAVHSTRPDLLAVTKSAAGKGSVGRRTVQFRNALVMAQIALSMALLCSAGLFIRSLTNVNRVQLGIRIDSLVTFFVSPGQIGYGAAQSRALIDRLRDGVATIPGVSAVATGGMPILRGWSSGGDVDVDGFPTTPDADVNSRVNWIGPDYFKTLGIPVLAGREFTPADDAGTPLVAVVNETFAKHFRLGSNPVGKRFRRGNALAPETRREKQRDIEIVGLVKDAAYSDVKSKVPPVFFTPFRQDTMITAQNYYVRVHGSSADVMRAIGPLVSRIEPNLPVSDLTTLPRQVKDNVYLDRMITTFSAGFAALATLLAAVGLYGVLAYTVAQRTREIGLRMALGADGARVRTMVLRQVGGMTLIGGTIGVAGAFGIGRSAQSLLYGLAGHDLFAFAGAAFVLTLVALAAGFVPALRASRVHPMEALRAE
jgi:predicted permease